MKKIQFTLTLSFIALVFLNSCVADLFNKEELHPPSVSIEKVENNEFNESILYFSVTEDENNDVDFVGISIKKDEPPRTSEGQELYKGTTGNLSVNLGLLSANDLYYVKAYAGNESGFAESEVYQFTPADPVSIEPPCTVNSNIINENSAPHNTFSSFASNNSGGGYGNYGIKTNYSSISGNRSLTFSFQTKPITGRYINTTQRNFDQFSSEIYIHFLGSSGVFKAGKYVYIDIDSNDVATIEFCDLEYEAFNMNFTLSGNFSTKLF